MVLDISFTHNRSYPNKYIQLLFDQLQRARSLYIKLDRVFDQRNRQNANMTWKFLRVLQYMPPGLEHLHISARDMNHDTTITSLDTPNWMPPNLKDKERLPKLRHVFLDSIPLKLDCGLFRNLFTLTLLNESSEPLTLSHILNISRACPDLEELTIHAAKWAEESQRVGNDSIFFFRLRLARLSIDEPQVVNALFRRLVFPAEANVWINTCHSAIDRPTMAAIVQTFALNLLRMQKPMERLGIALNEYNAGIYSSASDSTGYVLRQIQVVILADIHNDVIRCSCPHHQ
jgi:hypothetical protein